MGLSLLFADILIVDGAAEFVRSARLVLQSAGYIVRSVGSGEAAVEAVRARPPDLVLLDVALPGMDGYQAARQLKSGAPLIPVIMMVDGRDREGIAAALDAGADELIVKPVENVELLARVRAMLRLKGTADELAVLNATLEQKVVERTRELERANSGLRHAEKLTSLGRLAASIVHEINNPLTGILNYVFLAKQTLPSDSPVLQNMAIVERQVQVIAGLVQQLRDFSRPPRKERRPVVLNAVLEDLLALMGSEIRRRQIKIVQALEPELPPVMASNEQMSEVFLNLIINAQDAMPDGGTLTVRTSRDADRVQAQVSDTGSGIAPEVIDRVFEPFFTTKGERGTGLGLAICYSIIQDHSGEIRVESQIGQGTTFVIRLPRASEK